MNESSQSYIFLKIRFFLTFDRLTRSNPFVYFCNCNLAVSILITRYNAHFTHQTTFWSNTIFILYPHDRSTIIARIHSWRIVQFPPINYHVLACSIITFLADQLHANSSCPVINYYFRSIQRVNWTRARLAGLYLSRLCFNLFSLPLFA